MCRLYEVERYLGSAPSSATCWFGVPDSGSERVNVSLRTLHVHSSPYITGRNYLDGVHCAGSLQSKSPYYNISFEIDRAVHYAILVTLLSNVAQDFILGAINIV